MENLNSQRYLDDIRSEVLTILNDVEIAPSTQIFTGQIGTTQIPSAMPIKAERYTNEALEQSAGVDHNDYTI